MFVFGFPPGLLRLSARMKSLNRAISPGLSIFFQKSILQHQEIAMSVSNTFSNSEQPPSVNQYAVLRALMLLVPVGLLSLSWTSVAQHPCP